jgi:hypothetical protein
VCAAVQNGDLTLLRKSAGLHFDAPGSHAYHGGANTSERHLGDLGQHTAAPHRATAQRANWRTPLIVFVLFLPSLRSGNIVVKDDGVSFFSFAVDNLPLIDIAGRSLAIMSGEGQTAKTQRRATQRGMHTVVTD